MDTGHYGDYVTGVKFRRALFGYRRADVDGHLRAVRGWFALSGLDEALRDVRTELEADADRHRLDAEAEAARILQDARREADALVAEARREAELERSRSSGNGRALGAGGSFARLARLARR